MEDEDEVENHYTILMEAITNAAIKSKHINVFDIEYHNADYVMNKITDVLQKMENSVLISNGW